MEALRKRGNPNFGTGEQGYRHIPKDQDQLNEPLSKKAFAVKLPESQDAYIRGLPSEERGPFIRQAIAAAIAPGDSTPSSTNYAPGGFPLPPWPVALVEAVDSTMLRKMAACVGVSSRGDGGKQKSKDQLIGALRDGGYLL